MKDNLPRSGRKYEFSTRATPFFSEFTASIPSPRGSDLLLAKGEGRLRCYFCPALTADGKLAGAPK